MTGVLTCRCQSLEWPRTQKLRPFIPRCSAYPDADWSATHTAAAKFRRYALLKEQFIDSSGKSFPSRLFTFALPTEIGSERNTMAAGSKLA